MHNYLVVANQTLGGPELLEEIRRRVESGICSFKVVVPNTPPTELASGWAAPGGSPMSVDASGGRDPEREARNRAQRRLQEMLGRIREAGGQAKGELGDPDPLQAIADALAGGDFDEIIISTLPARLSRWLGMDLPSRAERRFGLPITTVVAKE